MKRSIFLLLIALFGFCWNGGPGGPISALAQTADSLQVISIKGQVFGPKGKSIQEYDYLESGREYRLLPETEVRLTTSDGDSIYVAVGPGLLLFDSKDSVTLNGKALKPKPQKSLAQDVNVGKVPGRELAGLSFRRLQAVPDQEKRSSIHEVDGYAYLSENMTLAQTRKAAFTTAKRQALEMAKTYIKSKSKVKEGILEYDLIWSDVEGAVSVLEQKDHGVEENKRYHVWIKAEVKYALEPKKEAASQAAVMDVDSPLTVKVWTDKKAYQEEGGYIRVFVQGNRDFYARTVNIDSQGRITQLLPNDYRNVNFFEAGRVYKIPDAGDRFALQVTKPYGEEQIVVYASEVPLGQVTTEPAGQGLRSYRGTRQQFARDSRSVNVLPVEDSSASGVGFYEATWRFTTSR
jgi:hypothetical protein